MVNDFFTENDIEYYPINKYPTIKFYPGNAKNKPPIDFKGDRTVDGFIKFLNENASNKIESGEENKSDL